ncbi:MAG: phage portal protein [Bacillota bacterium]
MPYIQIGRKQYDSWPPDDEISRARLENYYHSRLLFKGQHHEVFERIQRWLNREQDKSLVYVVCNFAGLLSKVSADMLFGEIPRFVAGEEGTKEQESLDQIIINNGMQVLNYEMALSASWRGEAIYKVRFGRFADWGEKDHAIIEAVSPAIFWPIIDEDNIRSLNGGLFGWVKEGPNERKYLRLERQLPGLIENELWLLDEDGRSIRERVKLNTFPEYAELPDSQETRYPGLLFEFVPNWRLDDEFWGISDYYDMGSIFDELNNRVSRISRVLDKHESPKLILPPGIMKWDERHQRWYVEKEDLEAIEVNPDSKKAGDLPRYLTWDAQLEAAFKQIDKLLELAFMISETSPDAFGLGEKAGRAESGRALKFRLLRLLAKINRKKLYFDQALKNVFYAAQYLEAQWGRGPEPADVRIEWQDGLPVDPMEAAQVEEIRTGRKATSSIRSAVRRLDGLTGEELEKELEGIAEDEGANRVEEPGAVRTGLNLNLGGEGEA